MAFEVRLCRYERAAREKSWEKTNLGRKDSQNESLEVGGEGEVQPATVRLEKRKQKQLAVARSLHVVRPVRTGRCFRYP